MGVDEEGNEVAIKRYKKETANLGTLQHELRIMRELQHENIVRLINVLEDATEKHLDESTSKCFAIIIEYVSGGELFDFVAETGKFSEAVSRAYFHQMMNGLHFMHHKGFAHRDIKPENILLSEKFVLKLADFGFSTELKGKDGSGVLHTKLGTEGYMAPEVPTKTYDGKKTDIFGAGVILFIIYAGNPPFEKATVTDPYYKLIKEKNYKYFWSAHSRRRQPGFFKDSFKDLFVRMVASNPAERITIEEIAMHPWVAEPLLSQNDLETEFTARKAKLVALNDARRREEEAQRNGLMGASGGAHRGTEAAVEPQPEFMEAYMEETSKPREIPALDSAQVGYIHFKDELPYFLANLKTKLKSPIPLDEGESEDAEVLKLKSIEDDGENKLMISFVHSYVVGEETFEEEVVVSLSLARESQNVIAAKLERESGNLLFFKKVCREIKCSGNYVQL